MAFPDDFINPILSCMNPTFTFPSITLPGLPNFCLANFEANFAGINYVLGFLPPDPHNLPSIPDISLFINPFMASVSLPGCYPPINVTLSGVNISIPGQGPSGCIPPYSIQAELNLIAVCIALPFLILKQMIETIIESLEVVLPTFDFVLGIIIDLFGQIGLNTSALFQFAGCLATAIVNLFAALIPT